jgi:hypothetical protein
MNVDTCAPKDPPLDDFDDENASYFTDATLAEVKDLASPSKCHFVVPTGSEGIGGVTTEWVESAAKEHQQSIIGTVIAYEDSKWVIPPSGHIN